MNRFMTPVIGAAFVALLASPALASLHPGDKIGISIYNHPELLTQPLINADGRVSVPIVGQVDATNLGADQLAERIRGRLVAYVRHPAVHVDVLQQSSSIFVAGGPGGVLAYAPGQSLTGAIAQIQQTPLSPGTQPATPQHDVLHGRIDLHTIKIIRDGRTSQPYDVAALISAGQPGPALQPGDTIALADKPVPVTVQGEVREPGLAHLDRDEPLNDALVQTGGPIDTTSSSDMILMRDGQPHQISFTSRELLEPAHPGDMLTVPHAPRVGVVGMVAKPGEVQLHGNSSLLSALYFAGGPGEYGDIRRVEVLHNGTKKTYDITQLQNGQLEQNPILADGDTVFVPENHKVNFARFFDLLSLSRYFVRPF